MDISPLRIAKFNELSIDNTYYRNYREAIDNMYLFETDMWNPHLGYNLHKRGYLPYMNPDMEKECDTKVAKALLYALFKGLITYGSVVGSSGENYFRYNGPKIKVAPFGKDEKEPINNKNIALLFTWLRNEDTLVDKWSAAYDTDIEVQMQGLPSITSDTDISVIEAALTKSDFMKAITEQLYEDKDSKASKVKGTKGNYEMTSSKGPNAIEFAYLMRKNEEQGRDCDDAERLLAVIYETFYNMCKYRASGEDAADRFIKIYTQQMCRVYNAVAGSSIMCKSSGAGCVEEFKALVAWLNGADTFKDVATISPIDANGNVRLIKNFEYLDAKYDNNNVKDVLDFIKKPKVKADKKSDEE
jgi:hypothetical protein